MAKPRAVDVVITYLEQTRKPVLPTPPRPSRIKLAILKAEAPPLHFYRYLYRTVGDPYLWVSRRALSDAALSDIIHDPNVHLYVLYADGVPAGMSEVDAREHPVVEIRFFGLTPEWVGRGVGRYFLTNVIDLAWSYAPERVRLETCTLDHPAALGLYQKHGFTVYDQKRGIVEPVD